MKRIIPVVQYGLGNVGVKLLELADRLNNSQDDIEIKYIAAVELEGAILNFEGIDIKSLIESRKNSKIESFPGFAHGLSNEKIIERIKTKGVKECVVVDVTASGEILPSLIKAIDSGYHVVMSNKKPLVAKFEAYKRLHEASKKSGVKLLYECTVGAGLPVIYTIQSLLFTGDKIKEINGCFSGTLGFIFSELEKGMLFSDAVKKAKESGYTEPDPREDLSGMDVARKALILARVCGHKLELEDFKIESLVPPRLNICPANEFLEKLENYDSLILKRYNNAKEGGKTLRYVASIKEGVVEVGVKEVALKSPLGSLKGPENICIIKTERYCSFPLIIQGPGAGSEVTADGVLRNILECFR